MYIDENYFKTDNPMKQNKVEDILSEDEQILQRLSPNKKVFILEAIFKGLPVALLGGAFDAFFIIMMINANAFDDNLPLLIGVIAFFAFHLLSKA